MTIYKRDTILVDPNELWFTTSGSSTFLTSGTVTFITTAGSTIPLSSATAGSASGSDLGGTGTTTTSAFTSQATGGGSNSGSPSDSSLDSLSSTFPIRPTSTASFSSATSSGTNDPSGLPQIAVQAGPVCIGDGMDATGGGLLATLLIPSVIGLIIWVSLVICTHGLKLINMSSYYLQSYDPNFDNCIPYASGLYNKSQLISLNMDT